MTHHTWRWRMPARAAALLSAAVLSLLGFTPSASADTGLQGNARFTSAGQRVTDWSAVGIGCRAFGFCDDVDGRLISDSVTRHRSTRQGEPLVVVCSVGARGELYRVELDQDGTSVFDGLTSSTGIAVDRGAAVVPC